MKNPFELRLDCIFYALVRTYILCIIYKFYPNSPTKILDSEPVPTHIKFLKFL